LPFPVIDQIEVGSYRPQLTLHAARQIGPVAYAAILIRQDIFAILHRRPLGQGRDDAGQDRLPRREHACPHHHDPEEIELVRRCAVAWPAAGRLRRYAMSAWISSSLSWPALVYDMLISQCPSASMLLRMARKISPSDQRFTCPAGVRLEATNDPTGM